MVTILAGDEHCNVLYWIPSIANPRVGAMQLILSGHHKPQAALAPHGLLLGRVTQGPSVRCGDATQQRGAALEGISIIARGISRHMSG